MTGQRWEFFKRSVGAGREFFENTFSWCVCNLILYLPVICAINVLMMLVKTAMVRRMTTLLLLYSNLFLLVFLCQCLLLQLWWCLVLSMDRCTRKWNLIHKKLPKTSFCTTCIKTVLANLRTSLLPLFCLITISGWMSLHTREDLLKDTSLCWTFRLFCDNNLYNINSIIALWPVGRIFDNETTVILIRADCHNRRVDRRAKRFTLVDRRLWWWCSEVNWGKKPVHWR